MQPHNPLFENLFQMGIMEKISNIMWSFMVQLIKFLDSLYMRYLTDSVKDKIAKAEMKGTPLPNIDGPSSPEDRIAIVGGGLAGIHMAYMLKKKNYKSRYSLFIV